MTLATRTPLRQCGRRWTSLHAAEHSKLFLNASGSLEAYEHPACQGVHLRPAGSGAKAAAKSSGTQDTFAPDVAARIDARDSDDSTGVPVRLCQRCGSTRNLHRHHRRLKGSGGSQRRHVHCACAGVTLCARCHGEVHANPRQATTEGWIVSRAVRHPRTVGVMRFAAAEGGATQWPACDGRWLETAPEAGEVAA